MLRGSKVFTVDNYDTLVTKAALCGVKLLKKPHQASAVQLASHMFWQESFESAAENREEISANAEAADTVKAVSTEVALYCKHFSDLLMLIFTPNSKSVLECLQKSLLAASSTKGTFVKVQLCCDTLDQYVYYLSNKASAVSIFTFKSSLV